MEGVLEGNCMGEMRCEKGGKGISSISSLGEQG